MVCNLWSTRGLSLFGKILIVNSLIASLFVYCMAVLPNPREDFYEKLDTIINQFIWNKKRVKIKIRILRGLKDQGGAGLVDLRKRNSALKIQWVFRAMNNSLIKEIAYELLQNRIGDLIWKIQLSPEHVKKMFTNKNFWYYVMQEWALLAYSIPTTRKDIKEEMLWYNSRICINDKPVCYVEWHKRGINFIADLLDENDQIFKYQDFVKKYNFTPVFTLYNGIVKAVSKQWSKVAKISESDHVEKTMYEKLQTNFQVKVIYRMLMSDNNLTHNKQAQLTRTLKIDISNDEFIRLCTNITKITICVKLRSFQYRLLFSALITNIHLFYYGIKETQLCTFCESQRGYCTLIIHM